MFLILHVGFVHYFLSHKSLVLTDDRQSEAQQHGPRHSFAPTVVLIITLVVLRLLAVFLILQLPHRLRVLNNSFSNDSVVNFVILPLVVVLADHGASIRAASNGSLVDSGTHLIQSSISTHFFLRPLVALGGLDVDPAGGRFGIGTAMIASAIWLHIPHVSSKL